MDYFVLRLERGGPWDWSRDMREQDGWDDHARFMDDLVDKGSIILGGPLEGDRETMHIIAAESEQAVRDLFATDPGGSMACSVPCASSAGRSCWTAVSTELVRLTIVPNEFAAETIIALLHTEGIESIQQRTDVAAGMADAAASAFGPREVLVRPQDLERARELIDTD